MENINTSTNSFVSKYDSNIKIGEYIKVFQWHL